MCTYYAVSVICTNARTTRTHTHMHTYTQPQEEEEEEDEGMQRLAQGLVVNAGHSTLCQFLLSLSLS